MGCSEFRKYLCKARNLGLSLFVREEIIFRDRFSSFSAGFDDWKRAVYSCHILRWGNRSECLDSLTIIRFNPETGRGEVFKRNSSLHLEIRIELPDTF